MTSALGSLLPTGDKGFLLDSQIKQENTNHSISVHVIFSYLILDVRHLCVFVGKKHLQLRRLS